MSPPILLLVGLLLTAAIAGEIAGAALLSRASRAVARLATAREHLDALVREQLSNELGLRGYIVTGDRSYLTQSDAQSTFDTRAQALRAEFRAAGIADADSHLDAFLVARHAWVDQIERPLLANPRRADLLAQEGRGRVLLRQMGAQARPLRTDLETAQDRIEQQLNHRIEATFAVSIVVIVIFAIGTVLLGRSRTEAVAALEREQSLVSALQQTLRVDGVPLPRTSVGFAYSSATREALVGGDLIDTWRGADESGWFLIADVSGKGVEAARHSAFVQYAIRTLSAEFDDPAHVLARFNELFLNTFEDDSIFVVAFVGRFDARSGDLHFASAGHGIAFVRRPRGVEQLAPTGPIIGMAHGEPYARRTLRLEAGETLVLATDGLTECRDEHGVMLGDEGVMELLAGAPAEPQALCDRLVAEAKRRSRGDVSDDLAILVLRIEPLELPAPRKPFSVIKT